MNLVRLAHDLGMSDEDVVQLLDISKGHLLRVRLEYDRLNAEYNSLKAKLNSIARNYQQFFDRIVGSNVMTPAVNVNVTNQLNRSLVNNLINHSL